MNYHRPHYSRLKSLYKTINFIKVIENNYYMIGLLSVSAYYHNPGTIIMVFC
jgi:hypothetical protein